MSTRHAIAMLFAAACLAQASSALAVTCTLNGSLRYQPADNYYCDTNHFSSCSGWTEVNLDVGDKPMRYMQVEIRNSANGAPVVTTHTNANGTFTATIPNLQSCAAHVFVAPKYRRIHESDLTAGTKRYRFRLTNANLADVSTPIEVALSGSSTTSWTNVMSRTQTDLAARLHGVYYTMNSAVTEIVGWSTNLSTRLASSSIGSVQKVMVDPSLTGTSNTSAASTGDGTIALNWDAYKRGGSIRHELGHWVHQLAHHRAMTATCYSDAFNGSADHNLNSCEYGYAATIEGMATFIAVRSVTSSDQNAWYCNSTSATQDACSDAIADTTDSDGASGSWAVIGDRIANSITKCSALGSVSCACGANCSNQTWKQNLGFRLETQVERFFWDMLDTNNEGGLDDTDLSMGGFIAVMEGMTCSGTGDGSCNEANVNPCTTRKRDAYNVYDYGDAIAGSQTDERSLNCVTGAVDAP